VGETQDLYCACGATRVAPINLTIVSCVQCGRAMAPLSSAIVTPPPSRIVVSIATLASQLLGTIAFALALVWIVSLRVTEPLVIGAMVAGAICVFAGGAAHRGNLVALGLVAAFDLGLAFAMLAKLPTAAAFLWGPLARIHADDHLALITSATGGAAALAALVCIIAMPQAKRFATWRDHQILHAARTARG